MFAMFALFRLGAVLRGFRTRRSLMFENLALRQQLTVFKRQHYYWPWDFFPQTAGW